MTDRNPLPSLREMLDAGCDLAETPVWLEGLAQNLAELPVIPAAQMADRAASSRKIADVYAEYGDIEREWLERWLVEVYDGPGLAPKVWAALPPALVERYRREEDQHRRPHPLEVGVPDEWWTCANCGAMHDHDGAEGVTIGHRPGFSEVNYPIVYCAGCITMAADTLRVTS